jgi:heat shock protein HtpX
MLLIALFLGTNLAVIFLISLTLWFLGFEDLLQQNGIDLNITALIN